MDDFLSARPQLFALAYRMLGSASEAEDVLQEAWLRWSQSKGLINPAAWLTTVVTRLCLDLLGSARVRRETYVGPWLPEPLVDSVDGPEQAAELADSVSLAFLVLLEELSPSQRAALLLREVFHYDYDEVAEILERTPASCRQLVSRARDHLESRRTRFTADRDRAQELTKVFLLACQTGDLASVTAMLAADAFLVTDGGGKVSAARRPVLGADRVARFLIGVVAKDAAGAGYVQATVNGEPGVVIVIDGVVITVVAVELLGDLVTAVRIVSNPDKLASVDPPTAGHPSTWSMRSAELSPRPALPSS